MVLKKLWPLFLLCLFSMACAGRPALSDTTPATASNAPLALAVPPSFFPSAPAGNGLVFIGATGKRSNPKETLQFALEDAARRVAIFHEVSGEYAVENNIGSGAFDYTHNTYTSLYYDKEGSNKYVDALRFNANSDTVEIENTFFVRTIYPSTLPVPVNYRPVRSPDQKPDWVGNPPAKIEGYEVGVGYSARHASLADTYTNSCNNAIFSIIRNVNTVSRGNNVLYNNTGGLFGYKTSSDNITYSYGILTGFYVLDTWIDPHTKTVWTLAIAKKFD